MRGGQGLAVQTFDMCAAWMLRHALSDPSWVAEQVAESSLQSVLEAEQARLRRVEAQELGLKRVRQMGLAPLKVRLACILICIRASAGSKK